MKIRSLEGKANIWEVDIRILLPNGGRIRERREAPVTGKTAAMRWAQEREQVLIKDGKPTREQTKEVPILREFAPRFVDGYVRANQHKPSGAAGKETILRRHLIPRFGDKSLHEITTEDVQQLKASLTNKSGKTVNNIRTVLNVLLKTAVEWKVIDASPCVIKWVRTAKREVVFHDFDAFERLVSAARNHGWQAQLVVLLGGEAGLRCGEMMALEWKDVNLIQGKLSVARSEWKGHVTTPKGGRVRYVPMTSRLTETLVKSRHVTSRRVLCDDKGQPLTQKEVQGIMRRVARSANVPQGVHILRHTFCSHLAMHGCPARTIQELAGHQDLSTTQTYLHLTPSALDAGIRLLETGHPSGTRGAQGEAAGTTD